ncbi:hypothetical protein [Streptomyces chartreusis]|uniref:hypothetical protein n=1 Tax=Streptomyces chartreusis TaxID=1969 RepID=UPI002E1911A0
MGLLSWLVGGNDGELAKSQYAGRESASAKAARKRRERYHRNVAKTDRKGQAWEDKSRSREVGTDWYRR